VNARTPIEARRRSLLRAVERALFDAIAESPELHRALWRLQRAGYNLRLSIDQCAPEPSSDSSARRPPDTSGFRIDTEDLRFLRSIGIDPTRPGRRVRKR
jgi:hypothetical protein